MSKTKQNAGFWRRQFRRKVTRKQSIYDWIFGVALPLICVIGDPVVFKGAGLGKGALLSQFKPFAYLLSFFCITAMIGWLLCSHRLKGWAAAMSGLFISGGIVSFVMGTVMLPLSLLGAVFGIGLLGLTPFFSAITYLRNGKRAFWYARRSAGAFTLQVVVLSCSAALVIPYVTNIYINSLINEMLAGDERTIRTNGEKLLRFGPLVNFDRLGGQYCRHPYVPEDVAKGEDPRHKVLAEIYEAGTGESIERIDFHICEDW